MADKRLATVPAGRLIGIADIAVMLGVQRATVDLWRTRDRRGRSVAAPLPDPVLPRPGDLTTTPLWDRDEVMTWALSTGRARQAATT